MTGNRRTCLLLAGTLVVLNAVDAACTLRILGLGAREVGPAMRFFVDDPPAFVAVKMILIVAGAAFLVRVGGALGFWSLAGCTAFYALVAIYQVALMAGAP